jgi:DNA-binding MarR family transcriptional regulator
MKEKQEKLDQIVSDLLALRPVIFRKLFSKPDNSEGINPGSHFILLMLKQSHLMTMTEIGNKLHIPKPNVTILVDKLIEKGLIERVPCEYDRRIINIRITEQGNNLRNEFISREKEKLSQKLSILGDSEIEQLATSLQNVNSILKKALSD